MNSRRKCYIITRADKSIKIKLYISIKKQNEINEIQMRIVV